MKIAFNLFNPRAQKTHHVHTLNILHAMLVHLNELHEKLSSTLHLNIFVLRAFFNFVNELI